MSLLIVNTMNSQNEKVQEIIRKLSEGKEACEVIHTENMKITHCIGCNACWLKTPGICAIKDDYEILLKAFIRYDDILFISGTSLGFVTPQMKNIIDRILPLVTMFTCFKDGQIRHVGRYNTSYRFGLIYDGEADKEYMNLWMHRVAINMAGTSLGAYPLSDMEEVSICI